MRSTELAMLLGASLSTVGTAYMAYAYIRHKVLRRHPNLIMVWKTTFDLLFALMVVVEVVVQRVHDGLDTRGVAPVLCHHCRWLGMLAQFVLFASEMCYTTLSFDLLLALRNPFTNYKVNRRYYAVAILVPALVTSLIIGFSSFDGIGYAAGLNEFNICWIRFQQKVDSNGVGLVNAYLWSMFFAPIMTNVLFAIAVLVYARFRLQGGLGKTYEQRKAAFRRGSVNLLSYAVFWIVVAGLNFQGYVRTNDDVYDPTDPSNTVVNPPYYECEVLRDSKALPSVMNSLFLFCFTAKGFICLLVFLWSNDFHKGACCSGELPASLRIAKAEADAELQPHLNQMLRQELAHYTRAAIIVTVAEAERRGALNRLHAQPGDGGWIPIDISRYSHILYPKESSLTLAHPSRARASFAPPVHSSPSRRAPMHPLRVDSSGTMGSPSSRRLVPELSMHTAVRYKPPPLSIEDLCPAAFGRIRAMFGVRNEDYRRSLQRIVKQRFSEGASGAFMCYSEDNRFVIKTMSRSEAAALRRLLPNYEKHLRRHPETLIAKFFGCTKLKLYTQDLYFVVMENVFRRCKTELHERYDLKGSWVKRTGHASTSKTQVHCRYCQEQFRVHDKEECPKRPNRPHVANTLLLDQDLMFKLRLPPDLAKRLGNQMRWDSKFLASNGIMDYSLLLGVKRVEVPLSVKTRVNLNHLYNNRLERRNARKPVSASRTESQASTSAAPDDDVPASSVGSNVSAASAAVRAGLASRAAAAAARTAARAGAGVGAAAASGAGARTDSPGSAGLRASAGAGSVTSGGAQVQVADSAAGAGGGFDDASDDDAKTDFGGDDDCKQSVVSDGSNAELPFYCQSEGGMMPSGIEGPGVFYVGIIDVLQEWTLKKRLERFAKRYLLCRDVDGLSATPPAKYQERFEERVIRAIIEEKEPAVKPSTRYGAAWAAYSPEAFAQAGSYELSQPLLQPPRKARSEGSLLSGTVLSRRNLPAYMQPGGAAASPQALAASDGVYVPPRDRRGHERTKRRQVDAGPGARTSASGALV